jgi:hypothetical protein
MPSCIAGPKPQTRWSTKQQAGDARSVTKPATAALGFGRAADDMTPKQLAVIERARHSPTRIVEIERTRRGTAYRNVMKRYSAKAALERELERLVGTWGRIEWQRAIAKSIP